MTATRFSPALAPALVQVQVSLGFVDHAGLSEWSLRMTLAVVRYAQLLHAFADG